MFQPYLRFYMLLQTPKISTKEKPIFTEFGTRAENSSLIQDCFWVRYFL